MDYWYIRKVNLIFAAILFMLPFAGILSQTLDPFIQDHVNFVNYDSVYKRMQTFEAFGIKTAGTPALENTRDWIIGLYQEWGYTDIELDEFTFAQEEVQNIIVTKTGSVYPDTYLIVDGHYDTWGGPGVNDNGSGTAIVLETARLMKDIETDYSIRFIHFTVEEAGLLGSYNYVENTVIPSEMDIRLVFNIDEVGGVAGEVNNTITCERDESSPNGNNAASAAFTDTLVTLTELYSSLLTNISYAYGSDYVPFMKNGYVVTGYYEYNESPFPHTINDSLSNLDPEYVYELAKASLASTMYFSGAYETVSTAGSTPGKAGSCIITPNPFSDRLTVENLNDFAITIELLDLHGQPVIRKPILPVSTSAIEANLPGGLYFYRILRDRRIIQTGKLVGR